MKTNFYSPILSIIISFTIAGIFLFFSNISPFEAYEALFMGAFSKPQYLSQIIIGATPLILTGLSVMIAFKAGLFNIGAEGQFILGTMTVALVGQSLLLPYNMQIPVLLILGGLAGAIYSGISGWLKAYYNVHEVLSTIMLNWIALYLSNAFVLNPYFRKPDTETTHEILDSSSIVLFENWKISEQGIEFLSQYEFLKSFLRPNIHAGTFISLFMVILVWYLLEKTTLGFKIKALGLNPHAADYAGMKPKRLTVISMMISGALAGLAGSIHVLGNSKNIAILAAHEGYGFDGIAISLIGFNHPIGVTVASFFIAALKYSGGKLQSALETPGELITIMIGLIILFISSPIIYRSLRERTK